MSWADDPAVAAADVAKLLADQPAESLVAKLQPAEVPAVEGSTIDRSAQKVEVPGTGSVVIIESNAQPTAGVKLAGELTAAQWMFRVAGEEDAGYAGSNIARRCGTSPRFGKVVSMAPRRQGLAPSRRSGSQRAPLPRPR